MLEAAALLAFPSLMAFAAASDLVTMTISNHVSLALVAAFLALAAAAGLPLDTVLLNLSCGAAVLVITFTLFACGWIGGGDAKFTAATAVWLGWGHMLDFGIVASLLGGLLTLVIIQMRKTPMPHWAMARGWIARLHDSAAGVPYGIALAAAGLFVYPQTQVWHAVAFG